jgi:hypothetical protein
VQPVPGFAEKNAIAAIPPTGIPNLLLEAHRPGLLGRRQRDHRPDALHASTASIIFMSQSARLVLLVAAALFALSPAPHF